MRFVDAIVGASRLSSMSLPVSGTLTRRVPNGERMSIQLNSLSFALLLDYALTTIPRSLKRNVLGFDVPSPGTWFDMVSTVWDVLEL
jgi:hypothetical protein